MRTSGVDCHSTSCIHDFTTMPTLDLYSRGDESGDLVINLMHVVISENSHISMKSATATYWILASCRKSPSLLERPETIGQ